MKKLGILLTLLVFTVVSVFAVIHFTPSVSAEVTTAATTAATTQTQAVSTTVPVTTTTINNTDNTNVYYYSDYDDLVSQIYNDVYNDVYNQVYQDVIDSLSSDYYQQIYDAVEQQLLDNLDSGQLDLYIDDFQQQIHDVVDISSSTVFGIETLSGDTPLAVGSGVVYKLDDTTNDYYIITNHHVVEDGNNFQVVFADGNFVPATLLGYDTEIDIAVLKFNMANVDDTSKTENIAVANLGDSDTLTKGSIVLAVGNPQGFDFYGSVTMGLISGLNREIEKGDYVKYIQHDASINAGNSGGALFDIDGNVIGINVAKFAQVDIEGMGFAIPINTVKEVIASIEDGSIQAYNTIVPKLGAQGYDVAALYDNGTVVLGSLGYESNITVTLPNNVSSGIIIQEIDPTKALATTTLGIGDLIYQIDDYVINGIDDYFDYIYSHYRTGDTVTLHYYKYNSYTYNYDPVEYTAIMTFK